MHLDHLDRPAAAAQVCNVTGATINVLRIPERWFQPRAKHRAAGRFDYWLNSHQLMHLLVTVAMLCLHIGATLDYEFSAHHPGCPEPNL